MVKIGRYFNGRHHTTVLHGIRKIGQLRQADETVDAVIELLARTVRCEVYPASDRSIDRQALLIEAVAHRVLEYLAALDSY